jgi:hypothetical protein
MIKWYLISYLEEDGEINTDIYALKKKEIEQYIRDYKVIAISKITERQARIFDRNRK